MMLSAVGAAAQVALQATTLNQKGESKTSAKSSEGQVAKAKDRVTISAEAVQMTRAVLDATEKSHDQPPEESEEESRKGKG